MKLRVTIDGQSFDVEVGDLNTRPVLATIEGEIFEVWPEESAPEAGGAPGTSGEAVQVARPAAPSAAVLTAARVADIQSNASPKGVLAPIPGVIIGISVKVGDSVSFGQELCVLEAMKMKNMIRATRSGKIGAIHITTGDQVKHSQVLMEFTD